MKFNPTQFFASSDLVIISQNPDMADMDNPRGEIIGYISKVECVNEFGDTRYITIKTSRWEDEAMEPAENLAKVLNARWNDSKTLPVCFDQIWREGRAIYGSEAWEAYGQDGELGAERRELENEAY